MAFHNWILFRISHNFQRVIIYTLDSMWSGFFSQISIDFFQFIRGDILNKTQNTALFPFGWTNQPIFDSLQRHFEPLRIFCCQIDWGRCLKVKRNRFIYCVRTNFYFWSQVFWVRSNFWCALDLDDFFINFVSLFHYFFFSITRLLFSLCVFLFRMVANLMLNYYEVCVLRFFILVFDSSDSLSWKMFVSKARHQRSSLEVENEQSFLLSSIWRHLFTTMEPFISDSLDLHGSSFFLTKKKNERKSFTIFLPLYW